MLISQIQLHQFTHGLLHLEGNCRFLVLRIFWTTHYIIMIFSGTKDCYAEMWLTKFPCVNLSSSIWEASIYFFGHFGRLYMFEIVWRKQSRDKIVWTCFKNKCLILFQSLQQSALWYADTTPTYIVASWQTCLKSRPLYIAGSTLSIGSPYSRHVDVCKSCSIFFKM
jgi:hypothetical protein